MLRAKGGVLFKFPVRRRLIRIGSGIITLALTGIGVNLIMTLAIYLVLAFIVVANAALEIAVWRRIRPEDRPDYASDSIFYLCVSAGAFCLFQLLLFVNFFTEGSLVEQASDYFQRIFPIVLLGTVCFIDYQSAEWVRFRLKGEHKFRQLCDGDF